MCAHVVCCSYSMLLIKYYVLLIQYVAHTICCSYRMLLATYHISYGELLATYYTTGRTAQQLNV